MPALGSMGRDSVLATFDEASTAATTIDNVRIMANPPERHASSGYRTRRYGCDCFRSLTSRTCGIRCQTMQRGQAARYRGGRIPYPKYSPRDAIAIQVSAVPTSAWKSSFRSISPWCLAKHRFGPGRVQAHPMFRAAGHKCCSESANPISHRRGCADGSSVGTAVRRSMNMESNCRCLSPNARLRTVYNPSAIVCVWMIVLGVSSVEQSEASPAPKLKQGQQERVMFVLGPFCFSSLEGKSVSDR